MHCPEKQQLKGHSRAISSLKFSPDGKWLASVSADKKIQLYAMQPSPITQNENIENNNEMEVEVEMTKTSSSNNNDPCKVLQGHFKGINDVTWSFDSRYIATASDDYLILMWDISTCKAIRTFKQHTNFVFSIDFNPTSTMLVSGSYDESMIVWNVNSGTSIRSIPAHGDPISSVRFTSDGTKIVSCSFDGLIRLWDSESGRCLKTLIDNNNPPVSFITLSPNCKYILASTLDNSLRLWSIEDGRCIKTYQGHSNSQYCIFNGFLSINNAESVDTSNPTCVVSGSEDGHVYIWDLQTKCILSKIAINGEENNANAVSPEISLKMNQIVEHLVKNYKLPQLKSLSSRIGLSGVGTKSELAHKICTSIDSAGYNLASFGVQQQKRLGNEPVRNIPKRLVSFDIGLCNFGTAIFDFHKRELLYWQVQKLPNLPPKYKPRDFAECIRAFLLDCILPQLSLPQQEQQQQLKRKPLLLTDLEPNDVLFLVESQRSRTGGCMQINEIVLRLNVIEAMLHCFLQGKIQSLSPRVISAALNNEDGSSSSSSSNQQKNTTYNYRLKKVKTKEAVVDLLLQGNSAEKRCFDSDFIVNIPQEVVPSSLSDKKAKIDDLADCLIQGIFYMKCNHELHSVCKNDFGLSLKQENKFGLIG